jgi:hypothetical protein
VKRGETSLADSYNYGAGPQQSEGRREKGLQQLREVAPDLADRVEDEVDKFTRQDGRHDGTPDYELSSINTMISVLLSYARCSRFRRL